jgi:hypothetical protein
MVLPVTQTIYQALKAQALVSNKGKLSTWQIHETSDLTSMVETLYKSGPTMAVADPLWLPWQGTVYTNQYRSTGHSTQNVFSPSDDIHGKELLLSNGGGCYGKRGKRGT